MANIDRTKIIRIYGVTLPDAGRVRPYGHGMDKINIDNEKDVYIAYVDYFIEDLVALIKKHNLSKKIIKELLNKNEN